VNEPDLFVLKLEADEPEIGDTMYIEKDTDWVDAVDNEITRDQIRGLCEATVGVRIVV
jgi:hypothetical protein